MLEDFNIEEERLLHGVLTDLMHAHMNPGHCRFFAKNKKHGANVPVSSQIRLKHLPDTRMTPHKRYGDISTIHG